MDEKKKRMTISMKEKYDKYQDNINNMNLFSSCCGGSRSPQLDVYLEYCLELIYGNDSLKKLYFGSCQYDIDVVV